MSSSSYKLDLAARAAWMYYVAGNTQNEIAERLGISRQIVQGLQQRYGLEDRSTRWYR